MLIGRVAEQSRIAALLDEALAGRSGALVIRGEAGIGKSALLFEAASTDQFQVLRARGLETESEIPFSGLHDLLAPILDVRSQLPNPQADAIGSALSVGPPVPVERLAICAGVLGLLSAASRQEPVLILIDDAHLLDHPSSDAIGFAARRLRDDRIAMLLTVRDGEGSTIATDGIGDMVLEPLDDSSAAALLERRGQPAVGKARADILALARGNPLAILELPLNPDADSGAPVAGTFPAGGLLSRAFGRRIRALPTASRIALAVAAASDDDDLRTVLIACRELSIGSDAFASAEAAGVVEVVADTITFRHPLVRAAAYAEASPADRREAHRALAAALVDRKTEDRWAWHRALAAVGPDEPAALGLEMVAHRSTSASSKARALERAAQLTPTGASRTRRLVAAALAAEDAGNLAVAEALAGEARKGSPEAVQAAEIDHLLGRVWTRNGEIDKAVDILTRGAATIATDDSDRAARMLADAVEAVIDDLDRAWTIAADAEQLLRPGSPAEQLVLLRSGDVHGWRGEAEDANRAWRRAADLADSDDPWSLRLAAEALFSAGLDDEAVDVARAAADLARDRNALNALTQSLEFLGQAEARRGRLHAGIDALTEELDLVVALGQVREERYARVAAAWVEAALGHAPETREHVERAEALEARMGWTGQHSVALGVLELALGQPDLAIAAFERGEVNDELLLSDAIAPRSIVPGYVEALVRVGRAADARPLTVAYEAMAERSGRLLAMALAKRCRGLTEGSTEDLEASASLLADAKNGYEEARTRLCLGELLRRRGKRTAARSQLLSALATFESVGAAAWVDRTRAELAVLGDRSKPRPSMNRTELTPQERNVARLVASGRSNREIAEHLFVTSNTVETHLRHIFQKLDVSSRTQLAIAFRE